MGFPGGSEGKESTAMQKTWVQYLCWENPLEKAMATHSNILAWIPWTEEPGRLQFVELQELDMTMRLTFSLSTMYINIEYTYYLF